MGASKQTYSNHAKAGKTRTTAKPIKHNASKQANLNREKKGAQASKSNQAKEGRRKRLTCTAQKGHATIPQFLSKS